MYISTTAIFLGVLSASALAAPVDNTDTSIDTLKTTISDGLPGSNIISTSLTKRVDYGWVGSYGSRDKTCQGETDGERPKIGAGCIRFAPQHDMVGITWGSYPLSKVGLEAFLDNRCRTKINDTIVLTRKAENETTCLSAMRHGGVTPLPWTRQWLSVKFTPIKIIG